MSAIEPITNRARTKIVATVGPACHGPDVLQELVGAGVDVFRLNMAHGDRAEHEQAIRNIRAAAKAGDRPLGILVDLAGPKIRLGDLVREPLPCPRDAEFHFVRGSATAENELTSNYGPLVDELEAGDRVLLADGTVEMVVIGKSPRAVTCRVTNPGSLRSRQGINLPGVKLSAPAMSEIDRENARWAASQEVDFVSLSFVRSAADIVQLKELLRRESSPAMTIAKIEKPEALDDLDAIVKQAGGIMIARGDLGVEIDVAEMPVKQKLIIDTCQRWKKPVIVATQMLDSMQRNNRPTRAEVTDVANAILDGTDACMLSGETAIGQYPVESVQMMNRIMLSTEKSMRQTSSRQRDDDTSTDLVHPITSAVVAGAGQIAEQIGAKMVVIATRSGNTALAKAKRRDFIPTVAVSDRIATLRQMCLFWGITPLSGGPRDLDRELIPFIDRMGSQAREYCKPRIVSSLWSGLMYTREPTINWSSIRWTRPRRRLRADCSVGSTSMTMAVCLPPSPQKHLQEAEHPEGPKCCKHACRQRPQGNRRYRGRSRDSCAAKPDRPPTAPAIPPNTVTTTGNQPNDARWLSRVTGAK